MGRRQGEGKDRSVSRVALGRSEGLQSQAGSYCIEVMRWSLEWSVL